MNNKDKLHKSKEIFFNLCKNKVDLENINFIDSIGATPLTWAIIFGKYDLVKYLLENNADTHIRVFPFVYYIIEYDWILLTAFNILSLILPEKVKQILDIHKIRNILHVLKNNRYVTENGIELKYVPQVCYEIFNFDCTRNILIIHWRTQEEFNNKMRLTFWLYPKIASKNNKYMQKFLIDPQVLENIRTNLLDTFYYNKNIYYDIYKLIPTSTTRIEEHFNKEWNEIIIPEFIYKIVVKAICNCM